MTGASSRPLERRVQLRAIRDALSRAEKGTGQLVLLAASAGLGKTSLLEATAHHAVELGLRVLRARGVAQERFLAFGGVLQLFEGALRQMPEDERTRVFDGSAGLSRGLFGMALRVHGLVQGGPEGTATLREAAAVLEGSPSRLEYARALVDLGAYAPRRPARVSPTGRSLSTCSSRPNPSSSTSTTSSPS